MDFALSFAAALLNTLVLGGLSKLVAGLFVSDKSARIAAFSVTLGFTAARYSGGGPPNRETALILAAALGAAAALALLWLWLLRPLRAGEVEEGG